MVKLNLYLNFPGKAEEAFNFYKSIFGRERSRKKPLTGKTYT